MPVLDLVRLPVPPMTPLWVNVVLASVLNVPPPAFNVVARLVLKLAVVCKVPPSKVSVPAALPRFASVPTLNVPALRVVPPV